MADDLRDRQREAARRAFAGRPPMRDGTLTLPSDRNPWNALDDALAVAWAVRDEELERLRAELEGQRQRANYAEERLDDMESIQAEAAEQRQRAEQTEAERDDARTRLGGARIYQDDLERQKRQAEAERVQAIAAVRTAWITHIRATHPTRMQDPACAVCQVLVPLSRDLPRKQDNREDILAHLAALQAERDERVRQAASSVVRGVRDALRPDTAPETPDCPRCGGSRFEPGTEEEGDWIPGAMRHHPYTGEPCTACGGTGKAPETPKASDAGCSIWMNETTPDAFRAKFPHVRCRREEPHGGHGWRGTRREFGGAVEVTCTYWCEGCAPEVPETATDGAESHEDASTEAPGSPGTREELRDAQEGS